MDPDAWLPYYNHQIFKRRVGQNGTISVGNQVYYVGYIYAGQPVGVVLDAEHHAFNIFHKGIVVRQIEIQGLNGRILPFEDYLKQMLAEARTIQT